MKEDSDALQLLALCTASHDSARDVHTVTFVGNGMSSHYNRERGLISVSWR